MENYNDKLFKGAGAKLFEFSNILRKTQTEAEEVMWQNLRNRKVLGFKFRRQHPLDKYIADFYCHEAKLVIEIDGKIHNVPEQQEYDKKRSSDIEEMGIKVIRFTNKAVNEDLQEVLNAIKNCLKNI